MKKIILALALFVVSSHSIFAQKFSGPSSVNSGNTITLTAVGESYASTSVNGVWPAFYYFISPIEITGVTYPSYPANASQYVSVTLSQVVNFYEPTTPNPTQIKINVVNNFSSPITVTFQLQTEYWHDAGGFGYPSGGPVTVPYTITINPANWGDPGSGIPSNPPTGGVLTSYLYRMCNSSGSHFYTNQLTEYYSLISQGEIGEGYLGYVYRTQQPGSTEIFRLRNNGNGDHFYTIDANESNNLQHSGWTYEGNAGFGFSTNVSSPATIPVYRYRSLISSGHFYTKDYNEIGAGNSVLVYEGIGFYILANEQ